MDDALYTAFIEETAPLAGEVERRLLKLERDAAALGDEWRALLGTLHSIKGNCGMVGMDHAQALAHAMEQRVRDLRASPLDAQVAAMGALLVDGDQLTAAIAAPTSAPDTDIPLDLDKDATPAPDGSDRPTERGPREPSSGAAAATSSSAAAAPSPGTDAMLSASDAGGSHVRVPVHRLDRLLESTEELAAHHERLGAAARALVRRRRVVDADVLAAVELVDHSRKRMIELRTAVTALRLLPLSTVLTRFERLVRDLCASTGKRAALEIRGGQVAVDRSVVDHIGEPLLHLVRNAVDHGIESPRERIRAGKPESGTITIAADSQGGVVTITVGDDGRGIDRARLRAAAERHGLDVAGLDDDQTLELVFTPELSTVDRVTSLSGRGIGLDQARRTLEAIGGSLRVASRPGQGTEFRLRAPAVLAVQRALLVASAGETYALPFTAVIEAFRARRGGATVSWRDREVARCVLADELGADGRDRSDDRDATCVVVERGDQPLAIEVDALAGQQDLIIKQLDPVLGRPRGVSGAAVLPDGRVVLVLDPHGLARAPRALRVPA